MALEAGKKCLCLPDGKGGYTAYEISAPKAGEKCILLPDGRGGYIAVGTGKPSVGDKVPVVPNGRGGYITWKPTTNPIELSYGWSFLFTHDDAIYAGWANQYSGNVEHATLRKYTSDGYTDYQIGEAHSVVLDYKIIGDMAYFLTTGFYGTTATSSIITAMDLRTNHYARHQIFFATDFVREYEGCPYTPPPYWEYLTFRGHLGYDGTDLYVITDRMQHNPGGGTTATVKVPISVLTTEDPTPIYIHTNYGSPGFDTGLIGLKGCGENPYPAIYYSPIPGNLVAESRDCAYINGDLVVEAYNHNESRWELMTPHSYSYLDTWDTICEMPGTRPTFHTPVDYYGDHETPYSGDMYVFNDELYTLSTESLYLFNGSSFVAVCVIPDGFTPITFQTVEEGLYLCGHGGVYKLSGSTLEFIGNPANETELVMSITKYRSTFIYGIVSKSEWEQPPETSQIRGRLYPTTI